LLQLLKKVNRFYPLYTSTGFLRVDQRRYYTPSSAIIKHFYEEKLIFIGPAWRPEYKM
jgi:hypothetical protein